MSKVLDSMWFNTAQGNFGIILAEDENTRERKLYAGVCKGFDQQADERAILSWGNKVNLGMLGSFLARAKERGSEKGRVLSECEEGTMPRIEEMYAFVTEDSGPDDEGVIGMNTGSRWLPMVGADMARVESLKPIAEAIAAKTGKKVKILRFSHREDLGSV